MEKIQTISLILNSWKKVQKISLILGKPKFVKKYVFGQIKIERRTKSFCRIMGFPSSAIVHLSRKNIVSIF